MQVTIYLTESDKKEALKQSKEVLGTENISGYFRFLINHRKNEPSK